MILKSYLQYTTEIFKNNSLMDFLMSLAVWTTQLRYNKDRKQRLLIEVLIHMANKIKLKNI